MSNIPDDDREKAALMLARILLSNKPMWEIMREAEQKRGFVPLPVGTVAWLPAEDWGEHDLVTLDTVNHEVRLVAIGARRKRTGAFTRLIIAIMADGYMPVVVSPLATMTEILEGWGWVETQIGTTFEDREEQWRPRCLREALGAASDADGTITPPEAATLSGGPAAGQGDENGSPDR